MILRRPRRTLCDCGLKAEVVLNPPREALMALARSVKPAARHYHHAAYWRHLYDDNPFRPKDLPWAVALMVDGVAEAMVTAVCVPTTQGPGALLAAWMRQPICHAAMAGALVLQPYLARQDVQLLAYDPSAEAARFYERAGWKRFDAAEWTGRARSGGTLISMGDYGPGHWERSRKHYSHAVERTAAYWDWRFARAPHSQYRLWHPRIAVGIESNRLRIEDWIGDITDSPRDLAATMRGVAHVHGGGGCAMTLETNNPTVGIAARSIGLRPGRLVPLYWRGAPADATCYRSLADADFGVRQWW